MRVCSEQDEQVDADDLARDRGDFSRFDGPARRHALVIMKIAEDPAQKYLADEKIFIYVFVILLAQRLCCRVVSRCAMHIPVLANPKLNKMVP